MTKYFHSLIEQYLSGSLSEDEANILMDAIASGRYDDELNDLLDNALAKNLYSQEESEKLKELIYSKISAHTGRSLFKRKIFRYAVAAMAIGCIAVYFYPEKQKQSVWRPVATVQPEKSLPDVAPGGNKATLTLADGSSIALDEAANGQIAKQNGATIIKTKDGQVKYELYTQGRQATVAMANNVMRTPKGGQYRLQLPDGTQAWLNASSSITYPPVFSGSDRQVSVTGEVYLEVAKDAERPFRVHVDSTTIDVLGTNFNVNAYKYNHVIRTTLIEGSLRVSQEKASRLLRPGEQAQVNASHEINIDVNVDLDDVVAWKDGYFSFNKTDLRTMMTEISEWYDVEVSYLGKVPPMQFGGKISRNSNLSEVLKVLELSRVRFRRDSEKKITVLPSFEGR